jgi:hypothetical protein
VTGYKYAIKDEATGRTLEVKYLLEVPGGYVFVHLAGKVRDDGEKIVDETSYEPALSTVRIIEEPRADGR